MNNNEQSFQNDSIQPKNPFYNRLVGVISKQKDLFKLKKEHHLDNQALKQEGQKIFSKKLSSFNQLSDRQEKQFIQAQSEQLQRSDDSFEFLDLPKSVIEPIQTEGILKEEKLNDESVGEYFQKEYLSALSLIKLFEMDRKLVHQQKQNEKKQRKKQFKEQLPLKESQIQTQVNLQSDIIQFDDTIIIISKEKEIEKQHIVEEKQNESLLCIDAINQNNNNEFDDEQEKVKQENPKNNQTEFEDKFEIIMEGVESGKIHQNQQTLEQIEEEKEIPSQENTARQIVEVNPFNQTQILARSKKEDFNIKYEIEYFDNTTETQKTSDSSYQISESTEIITPFLMSTLGVLLLKQVFGLKGKFGWVGAIPGVLYGSYQLFK